MISFVVFTAAVAVVAYLATRNEDLKSASGYFLAGRSLGAWVIAGSLLLTNLSTEHLIGLNADAYNHTIAVMAWETTAAIAIVATALYFLPRYLAKGLTTIPEFLGQRFDKDTRLIASILFVISYATAILPVVLIFGAEGLERLFNVSETFGLSESATMWVLVWMVGSLGAVYAVVGGLKAVAVSDTVNGIGFLLLGLAIPFLALSRIGDGDVLQGLGTVYQANPEKFDITGDEPGSFLPFGVIFTGMIVNQVFFWCVNQSILQRTLGARSLAAGQKGLLLAAALKLLGPVIVVLPGVLAYHLFKDVLAPEDYLQAYPMLVNAVLPEWMIGIFAAVMVGAILSTFNSVLNSTATLIGWGIADRALGGASSDSRKVWIGKAASVVLALFAMTSAPLINTEGSLYNYLQQINATFFGPMLAVILIGLFTKKVNAIAAKIALVAGPAIFYLLVFAFDGGVQKKIASVLGQSDGIHFLHFLAVVFVLTVVLMLAVGRVTKKKHYVVEQPGKNAAVDLTPWKLARPTGAIIVVATVVIYVVLAR